MVIKYYLFGIIFLLTAIATMYVAHRGYWADPKGRKNKLFLFLSTVIVIWLLGETGYWLTDDLNLMLAFYHFKYVGIILISPAFFFMANAVPIWRNILNKKWIFILLLGISGVFEIICVTSPFTNLFFSKYVEEPTAPGKYYGSWTLIWWMYAAYQYLVLILGIISLAISIKQARTKIEKNQARILIFAVVVPLVGNAFNMWYFSAPDPTSLVMSFSTILLGYAISKYRLLSITAETEKTDGVKEKIPFMVEHGYNYVIVDNHTNAPYFLLRTLSTQKPGLCVTGKPPAAVRSAFKIEKLPIIWITEVETEEQAASPERLDFEIAQSIINFMRENPGSTVLIDDIEYLTTKCGFEAVSNFLKDIVDVASTTNSTFITQVRPAFFDEDKRKMLTSIFDKEIKLPSIEPEKKNVRTHLHYRKEETLDTISRQIPQNEKVLVITRTHPKKVEKYFEKADYYWITDIDIDDIKTIKPEAVDTDFIVAIKDGIKNGIRHIVIDGCDVVKLRIDFNKYLGFIKDLTDLAHKYGINLYCIVETSDEKENVAVSNRFDVVVR
ncbi:MAG: DUF835 domain-containing protein [Thermoplasmata archaeon]